MKLFSAGSIGLVMMMFLIFLNFGTFESAGRDLTLNTQIEEPVIDKFNISNFSEPEQAEILENTCTVDSEGRLTGRNGRVCNYVVEYNTSGYDGGVPVEMIGNIGDTGDLSEVEVEYRIYDNGTFLQDETRSITEPGIYSEELVFSPQDIDRFELEVEIFEDTNDDVAIEEMNTRYVSGYEPERYGLTSGQTLYITVLIFLAFSLLAVMNEI